MHGRPDSFTSGATLDAFFAGQMLKVHISNIHLCD
jgi:hypothetical protein